MPHYSIDVHDGHSSVHAPARRRSTSPEAARDRAVRLLTKLAQTKAAEGDGHLLVGVVKDGADRAIYRVLLTIACTKLQ